MVLKQVQRNLTALLRLDNTLPLSPYNSSKLLSVYFKSGRVYDAEKLFDEMHHRNIVSWSIAIHGYAINGFHRKSINSFSQMRKSDILPNSFAVVGVLVAAAGMRDFMLTKSVHGVVVKSGLESYLIVSTAVLDAYGKCGNVDDSYEVFKELKDPGLVSRNAILAGFVNNGLYKEGILLFERFRIQGMVPNVATALILLSGCVGLEMRMLCESVHGFIIKLGLISDLSVNNSVLDMYSQLVDLRAAIKVLDEMEGKDVISWTTMMGLLVYFDLASDALELFVKTRDSGVNFDTVFLMHLVSACGILGDLKRGRQIHAHVLACGFEQELSLANTIISMYSKCGDLVSSRTVFDQTIEKSLVSWTAVISGYVQNGCSREALNLVMKVRENYYLDPVVLISALTASGELAVLEYSQQLHCYALKAGFSEHRSVQNSLISTYAKCGNVDVANIVFKEMGNLRNVVSWNAIINGYGINGHGETALSLYYEMRMGGEDPDEATFLSILSACSHAGLIKHGLMIFKTMIEHNNVRPSKEHYGCLVDLLARADCLSDASVFDAKFLEGMGPNAWKALLSRCALNGNVGLAEVAAKKVHEQEPGESEHIVLLSNVYASVGRFHDAEGLRLSMQNKGFIKNPGISFLNEKSYNHG